ncbi:biological adhesion [Rhizoctonia solani]|uniref:Biological adhesion n=1 Tax=Rhizoctonia solani TaxID=456999 RepID=A0A8H7IAL5_9AGAM|nr:biological adhesion [Rhizoctonia solani]
MAPLLLRPPSKPKPTARPDWFRLQSVTGTGSSSTRTSTGTLLPTSVSVSGTQSLSDTATASTTGSVTATATRTETTGTVSSTRTASQTETETETESTTSASFSQTQSVSQTLSVTQSGNQTATATTTRTATDTAITESVSQTRTHTSSGSTSESTQIVTFPTASRNQTSSTVSTSSGSISGTGTSSTESTSTITSASSTVTTTTTRALESQFSFLTETTKLVLPSTTSTSSSTSSTITQTDPDAVVTTSTSTSTSQAPTTTILFPSELPRRIVPLVGGVDPAKDANQLKGYTLISLLFTKELSWAFVAQRSDSVGQLFAYTPVLQTALNLSADQVKTFALQAFLPASYSGDPSEIRTTYMAYIPDDKVDELSSQLRAKQSTLYSGQTSTIPAQLASLIDPSLPVNSGSTGSTGTTPNSGGSPGGNGTVEQDSGTDRSRRDAIIGVCTAFGIVFAAVIGFFLYKKAQRKREQAHRPISPMYERQGVRTPDERPRSFFFAEDSLRGYQAARARMLSRTSTIIAVLLRIVVCLSKRARFLHRCSGRAV